MLGLWATWYQPNFPGDWVQSHDQNPNSTWTLSSVELPGWWTHWCAGRVICPDFTGKEHRNCLGPFGTLPHASFHLDGLVCILYNTTIIVSIALFWVLWIILESYQSWGWSLEAPIFSYLVRYASDLGGRLWLASEVTAVLWSPEVLNLWGLY